MWIGIALMNGLSSVETAYSTFKRTFGEFFHDRNHEKHSERTGNESIHLQHAHKPIEQATRKTEKSRNPPETNELIHKA